MIQCVACSAEANYLAAIDLYTQAIEQNPTSAVYFSNRAAAHIKVEEHGSAMIDAGQAIKLDPKYVKVQIIRLHMTVLALLMWRGIAATANLAGHAHAVHHN
jgi:tetratricopeptide (TPR) repeat protein